jgi:hypothetical protein
MLARATGMLIGVVFAALSGPASAQQPHPSGQVVIHQVSVAFVASAGLGRGTFSYHGHSHRFSVGGLGVGGMGVSRLDAGGTVYNLERLSDFNGAYLQFRSGFAAGQVGQGQLWLRNAKGVVLRLRAQRRGLALTLGADGMIVELKS